MIPYEPSLSDFHDKVDKPTTDRRILRGFLIWGLIGFHAFLFYVVIPRCETVYKDFGVPLPRLTVLSIEASHLLIRYSFLVIPALAAVFWWNWRNSGRYDRGRVRRTAARLERFLCFVLFTGAVAVVVELVLPLNGLLWNLSG